MKFWTVDGKVVVNSSGLPYDCPGCPCPDDALNCLLVRGGVPANLTITYTYAGVSLSFPLVWNTPPSEYFLSPPWSPGSTLNNPGNWAVQLPFGGASFCGATGPVSATDSPVLINGDSTPDWTWPNYMQVCNVGSLLTSGVGTNDYHLGLKFKTSLSSPGAGAARFDRFGSGGGSSSGVSRCGPPGGHVVTDAGAMMLTVVSFSPFMLTACIDLAGHGETSDCSTGLGTVLDIVITE